MSVTIIDQVKNDVKAPLEPIIWHYALTSVRGKDGGIEIRAVDSDIVTKFLKNSESLSDSTIEITRVAKNYILDGYLFSWVLVTRPSGTQAFYLADWNDGVLGFSEEPRHA